MPFRITDASSSARLTAQVIASRQRVAQAQEQISTGRRINRPSDDPTNAGVVFRVRAAQTEITQFERSAGTAHDTLIASDSALENYELALDRVRTLLTQGASETSTPNGRQASAVEIDTMRMHLLGLANQRYGPTYLFGGTRQDQPPFDANAVPASTPTTQQTVQIDPGGGTVVTGVTAETIFSDTNGTIFETLNNVASALRGTGDPVADRNALLAGLAHLDSLSDRSRIARAQIGANIERTNTIKAQLAQQTIAYEETAQRTEAADFVQAAVQLKEAQQVLDALLQAKAVTERRTLLDMLG